MVIQKNILALLLLSLVCVSCADVYTFRALPHSPNQEIIKTLPSYWGDSFIALASNYRVISEENDTNYEFIKERLDFQKNNNFDGVLFRSIFVEFDEGFTQRPGKLLIRDTKNGRDSITYQSLRILEDGFELDRDTLFSVDLEKKQVDGLISGPGTFLHDKYDFYSSFNPKSGNYQALIIGTGKDRNLVISYFDLESVKEQTHRNIFTRFRNLEKSVVIDLDFAELVQALETGNLFYQLTLRYEKNIIQSFISFIFKNATMIIIAIFVIIILTYLGVKKFKEKEEIERKIEELNKRILRQAKDIFGYELTAPGVSPSYPSWTLARFPPTSIPFLSKTILELKALAPDLYNRYDYSVSKATKFQNDINELRRLFDLYERDYQ